jgi:hypothetical protein
MQGEPSRTLPVAPIVPSWGARGKHRNYQHIPHTPIKELKDQNLLRFLEYSGIKLQLQALIPQNRGTRPTIQPSTLSSLSYRTKQKVRPLAKVSPSSTHPERTKESRKAIALKRGARGTCSPHRHPLGRRQHLPQLPLRLPLRLRQRRSASSCACSGSLPHRHRVLQPERYR